MAQPVDFEFSFAPFKTYQDYSGEGGSDPFPFDGIVEVKLTAFTPYFSSSEGGKTAKPMIKVFAVAQDADAKGLRLISDVHCGGLDKNEEDMGRQFIGVMRSSGTTLESIHKNAETGAKGAISTIAAGIKDRSAWAEIEADVYEGRPTTRVKNWVTKERAEQAKSIGAHRRPRRAVGAVAGAPVGGVAVGGAANGTVANPAAAGAGASSLPLL